jgi:hypothetical protein
VTGQPVTFTATVAAASPSTGTPTGSVTFSIVGADSSSVSCDGGDTVALSGDSADCAVSGGLMPSGSSFTVAAAYAGDPNFASSNGTLSQTVQKGGATITVAMVTSPPTTNLVTGQPVNFVATVAVSAPAVGTPTGSVVFSVTASDGATVTCDGGDTSALSGATAPCTFALGLKGAGLSYTVSAALKDPNFKTPVAGTLVVAVGKPNTATTI